VTDECETEEYCDICECPMEKDYNNPYSEEVNGVHVQLMLCNFCYSDVLKEPLSIKWSIERCRKKEIEKRMRPLDYFFEIEGVV